MGWGIQILPKKDITGKSKTIIKYHYKSLEVKKNKCKINEVAIDSLSVICAILDFGHMEFAILKRGVHPFQDSGLCMLNIGIQNHGYHHEKIYCKI